MGLGYLDCNKVIFTNIRSTSGSFDFMKECVQARLNQRLKNGAVCRAQEDSLSRGFLRESDTIKWSDLEKERN